MRKLGLTQTRRAPGQKRSLEENLLTNTNELSATTRLFSAGVIRELATRGQSALFARLLELSPVRQQCESNATVGDAYESAFSVLKKVGLRHEYIYRAALTEKILLGVHSLKTASMLTEFRAGKSKADLIILNGTATVYEIKSERDSLSRLIEQIANYQKVFAKIYVISAEVHVDSVLSMVPECVGIVSLSPRGRISTKRVAVYQPELVCPTAICDSLRISEACEVLRDLGIAVPNVPNIRLHAEIRNIFSGLDPAAAHVSMVRVLKQSRNLASLGELVDQLPRSLHAAALTMRIKRGDHKRLIDAMATPLPQAMSWT